MKSFPLRFLSPLLLCSLVSLNACGPDDAPPATPQPSGASSAPSAAPAATAAPSAIAVETGACGTYVQTDNALTNGDFEAPTVRQDQQIFSQGAKFTNWTVTGGSVTIFSASSIPKPSGNQVLGFAGSLSQTVSTLPNKQYALSFCYATAPGASSGGLAVSWNGMTLATLPLDAPGSSVTWKGARMILPGVTVFQSPLSLNGQGVLIDGIKLTLQP